MSDELSAAIGDGSAAAPAGDSAGTVSSPEGGAEASNGAPAHDAEFLKRLESLDPAGLPEPLRRKLELPFNQEFTRQRQAQAEVQNRTMAVLDKLTERLASQGTQPTESQRKLLSERIAQGDLSAVDALMENIVQERVRPIESAQALRDAVETAQTLHPYVKAKEQEIAQIINGDPTLKAMATANNFKFAPQVLAGLALQIENAELKAKLGETPKQIEAAKKAAIEAFKKESMGVPTTTTRAGTTSGKASGPAEATTVMSAAQKAWIQMGNSLDTFR